MVPPNWVVNAMLLLAVCAGAVGQIKPVEPVEIKPVKPVDLDKPASAKESLLQWGEEARTHVSATRIVRGVIRVDMVSLRNAIAMAGYVDVHIDVLENIYGPEATRASFRVYMPKTGVPTKSWEMSSKDVTAWHGQDRIVFLTTAEGGLYLASDEPAQAVVAASRYKIMRVRHRETLHRTLLATPLQQDRTRQLVVDKLMRRMCGGKQMQFETFFDLEDLGSEAVVEIIAAMDVRRKLPEAAITLRNKAADRFEAVRHYAPVLGVDAVEAILNQIVGESFGSISSSATDAARDASVRGWTLYAHYVLAQRSTSKPSAQESGK